ncbi:IS5 family transposase [Streptomyces sp. TP-A0356]|uniref:IS5 family transposase n=1 Tax=Streptomyces sp. TP-A0356 TaxID=1359208 RepID=UPI0006E2513E|nr:IS5 family transposase [Streptomyces sp. TP-A0356]
MSERRGYYTDTTDEQWALIEPVITAWKAAHPSVSGHTGRYAMRAIVDALLYQIRSGCQWSLHPAGFPPASAVKCYFYRWRDEGLDQVIHEILRCQVRERAGRAEDPSLVVLDTQSLHAAVNIPASTTGLDAAKKVPGRKRGIAVDIIGLVIAVVVLAASVHDNQIGTALLTRVASRTARVSKALVDQGFKNTVVEHGAALGIDVEIVERNAREVGFAPQPIRWRVEQTLVTLMLQRRLVRGYEANPPSSESRVYWAITAVMARRLTGAASRTWRGHSGMRR